MTVLSQKDRRLLFELDTNARQPLARIARKIGVSKEVAGYRLKRLEQEGIVAGYYPVLDLSKLGYAFFRVMLRFENMAPEKEDELIKQLALDQSVGWLATLEGNWDLVVVMWARNVYEFKEKVDVLLAGIGRYVKAKLVTIATKIYHFKKKYLYEADDACLLFGDHELGVEIDESDYRILLALSKDARVPLVEIANGLGVTASAVNYRIKRMERDRLILGYRALVDIRKFFLQHFKVFLYTDALSKSEKGRLIEYLRRTPEVVYITEAVGPSDLEFEVHVKSSTQLFNYMKRLRSDFQKAVKDYEVLMTYEEHRINYLPEIF